MASVSPSAPSASTSSGVACTAPPWLVSRAPSVASKRNGPTSCGSATCSSARSCPYPRAAGSKRAYLFLLVDDYSRLLIHGRWVTDQNTRAGQDVLRAAIQRRGLPERLYVDNGAPYANAALERSCAVLGIRLIHSRPYRPKAAESRSG